MSIRNSRAVAAAVVTFATFTDILAYSIAVPVLPALSRRFGASPTVIGLLFASFGVTVLAVSVPMGAISDRTGRKLPLVAGLVGVAISTVMFALADQLWWLFAARLVQGAADAVTWVVGFALIADLYRPDERGRVMGLVMSGTTFGFMIGPTIGGWLYETGGARMPFLVVAALAAAAAAGFAWLRLPAKSAEHEAVPIGAVIRVPSVAACAAAVAVGGGTLAMLEPVLSLFLTIDLGLGPARIGLVFGAGAVVLSLLHPIAGRVADRVGARQLTMAGLVAIGMVLPLLGLISSFQSAVMLYALGAATAALVITPSLAYMAEATSSIGVSSFGVAYGLYNFAWALGLLVGPSIGGFLYEQLGFSRLTILWAPFVIVIAFLIARVQRSAEAANAV
jgi:multidrug resistance protein